MVLTVTHDTSVLKTSKKRQKNTKDDREGGSKAVADGNQGARVGRSGSSKDRKSGAFEGGKGRSAKVGKAFADTMKLEKLMETKLKMMVMAKINAAGVAMMEAKFLTGNLLWWTRKFRGVRFMSIKSTTVCSTPHSLLFLVSL